MNSSEWQVDRSWKDRCGNELRMLQKPLTDLMAACGDDLIPFFHENSVFIMYGTPDNKDAQVRVEGTLLELSTQDGKNVISILPMSGQSHVCWKIDRSLAAHLTVWRVNDYLDALQVNLQGGLIRIYMQVGGTAVSQVFQAIWLNDERSMNIEEAMAIFSSNTQGHVRYG